VLSNDSQSLWHNGISLSVAENGKINAVANPYLFTRLILIASFFFLNSCTEKQSSLSFTNSIAAASVRIADSVTWYYDAAYYRIPYPNGDVPGGGACTDVVIRVLRMNGIDLQKEVHDDITQHFDLYPKMWGLSSPDPNIDHRRVPNLMTYFKRKGYEVTDGEFKPGDIVCWNLSGGMKHIGIYLKDETVFHNMGPSSRIEEGFLRRYPIIGHYRYTENQ